jgi:hypothetical protein
MTKGPSAQAAASRALYKQGASFNPGLGQRRRTSGTDECNVVLGKAAMEEGVDSGGCFIISQ